MTVRAPFVRRVDALSGEVAARPSRFMRALSEADNFVAEAQDLRVWQRKVADALGMSEQVGGARWCADADEAAAAAAEGLRASVDNAELETRVQELTAERDEARALAKQWRDTALSCCPHAEGDL